MANMVLIMDGRGDITDSVEFRIIGSKKDAEDFVAYHTWENPRDGRWSYAQIVVDGQRIERSRFSTNQTNNFKIDLV